MKRLYLFNLLLIVLCTQVFSQENERILKDILNGEKTDAYVVVEGIVDKWDQNPSNNTISYVLRDNWGDSITVVSNRSQPEINQRYRVEGYVTYQQAKQEYQIMEQEREILGQPTPTPVIAEPTATPTTYVPEPTSTPILQTPTSTQTPTPVIQIQTPVPTLTMPGTTEETQDSNWGLILLIIAVIIVLIILVILLMKDRQPSQVTDFDETAVVTVADKTQKVSAPVANSKAIQEGTVKIMPGRFEIAGGVDLKEIRLVCPRGVGENQIQYTFGRLPGDKVTHIQLNDPTVSSQQARMKYQEGHYVLVNIPDPNDPERNATMINGKKMNADEEITLKEGDTIQMGHVQMVFHEK